MVAIIERTALSSFTAWGFTPDEAIAALATIKPVAHYEGKPYYSPKHVYKIINARR